MWLSEASTFGALARPVPWSGRWDHPHKLVVIGNHDVYGRGDTALMARMLPNATHVFDAEEVRHPLPPSTSTRKLTGHG